MKYPLYKLEILEEAVRLTTTYHWNDTNNNIRILNDVRESIDNLPETPSTKHIAEIAIACRDNIQMRDFLMGVGHIEKPKEKVTSYLALINSLLPPSLMVPTLTVLSSYMYNMGQKDKAVEYVETVLNIQPEYPLAGLLQNVYNTDAPTSMFKDMADSVHQTVINNIYSNSSELV